MNTHEMPKSAHITKRLICALLAIGGVAVLALDIVTTLYSGQVPNAGGLVGGVSALVGTYIFGLYAVKGGGNGETGVLSEPSENVKNLALRRDSKIEAIQAYRQQTGVDVKRAKEVVERLALLGRSDA